MSSSDRRTVLLMLGALPLAACGFAPAYGPGGAGAALHGAVRMAEPRDENAWELVVRLEERLGRAAAPRYALDYTVTTEKIGAGITPSRAITRYTMTGAATFRLTESATGTVVAEGRVEGFTGWSATGSTVATLTAEEDARVRLMRILADRIVTRLLATGAA
ncbi:LPS assembly lipoprotein LptE [Ruixingdingia sedimenti]|uniref:LPS assembly lipoprotein LptE n=1 Tax=Ruixingdingia sedimenti TaxID=3073604 RepID=A0ABU1F717_9RHOB|nr:LPS assembly lipoprotein LptE [Xinfangfangia sp. LG-4]MDR5652393.1 LPS assembly lipoprotein LptE [Xinfangfangia sp. LG-4]